MNRAHVAMLVTLCAAALYAPHAHAAAGDAVWANFYKGLANGNDDAGATAIVVDGSGNAIVTGYSYAGENGDDFATIKYSGAGVPLWTNRYDGPDNGFDGATAIAVDGNGSVFVTGHSYGSPGTDSDYVTLAYSAAGMPLWTNRYNGPGNASDRPTGIAVDAGGNVFVTGESAGLFPPSSADYATIKYSGAGVPLWTNRYNGPGNSGDYAKGIAADGSGDVFVTGYSYGTNGHADYATIKYSGAGVPLWTNRYPGGSASAVAVDASGNVFVTGTSLSGNGSPDYATIKYSGAGVSLWTNRYAGTGDSWDQAYGIAVDASGNVIVSGSSGDFGGTNSDYVMIKYSGSGESLWTNRYNGRAYMSDEALAVAVDRNGSVFATGIAHGGSSGDDYVTLAYSGAGVPLWTNRYNGPENGHDQAFAIAVDGSGNVFVTGESQGSGSANQFATIKYAALPARPSAQALVQPGKLPTGVLAWAVAVSGNYAYVVDLDAGLQVIDVSSPAHCVRVGGYGTVVGAARGVVVAGHYAYVTDSDAGLQVIDVSNPAHCVRVGGYDTSGAAIGVAVAGHYAFVAGGFSGLQVIDVGNPTNCVRVGGYDTSGSAESVAVAGHYAYVADYEDGLQVIDVSNPTNCVRVGGYDTSGFADSVVVVGHYAYVADGHSGLQVIDVSNPTHCVRVGGYDTSGFADGVAVAGNYAYVTDFEDGLQVIDVSNPTHCVRVAGYDTGGTAQGVAVVAGRIYVADGEAGLLVLPTVRDFQFTVRVEATPGVPFTIEAATDLSMPWSPLVTTNVATMPFDYVDFDVKITGKPHKFYRVRQP